MTRHTTDHGRGADDWPGKIPQPATETAAEREQREWFVSSTNSPRCYTEQEHRDWLASKRFDPEALKKAGIIVHNHPGQPIHRPSPDGRDHGGATWTVPWDTTVDPSKAIPGNNKGWIGQHVTVDVDARDALGNRIPPRTRDAMGNAQGGRTLNPNDDYLEAWRVDSPPGHQGGKVRAGEEEKLQGADTFQVAPEAPGTHGRVTVRGRALFLDSKRKFPDEKSAKWNWPARGGHKKDPTISLPSTRDPDEIKKIDTYPNAADHLMIYEWDTRDPDPTKHKFRRYGGLGVPPPNLRPVQ